MIKMIGWKIIGVPLLDIFWYLNGQRLIQDDRHRIIVNEAGCHALMFTSAKLDDAGTILCLAKNGSGEAAFQVTRVTSGLEQL